MKFCPVDKISTRTCIFDVADFFCKFYKASMVSIGVGRFRILWGPKFRIIGAKGGGQIPSRHMTS